MHVVLVVFFTSIPIAIILRQCDGKWWKFIEFAFYLCLWMHDAETGASLSFAGAPPMAVARFGYFRTHADHFPLDSLMRCAFGANFPIDEIVMAFRKKQRISRQTRRQVDWWKARLVFIPTSFTFDKACNFHDEKWLGSDDEGKCQIMVRFRDVLSRRAMMIRVHVFISAQA